MKPPPEEKLLKLIRGKGTRPSAEAAAPQTAGAAAMAGVRAPDATARARALPWLKVAIGVLGAVVCLELAFFFVQALWPLAPVTVPVVPLAATAPSTESAGGSEPVTALSPDVPSVAASASRALFAAAAPAAHAQSRPSGSANQLASRLTLMGIVAGDPAQAIIEDSQTQRTYFVTAGQAVVEGAVLEQVLDNRVVLDLAGEKIELTL